jgi:hypothetical protein
MPWTTPTNRSTGFFVTATVWDNEVVGNQLLLKTCVDDAGNVSLPAPTTLTLATDACTPVLNAHKVDTEAAAATDNLSTLTVTGSIRNGHLLLLMAANAGRLVTVKSGIGNVTLRGGDCVLDNGRILLLMLVSGVWFEVARAGGDEPSIVSKTTTYAMVDADDIVLCTSGTFAVTLPAVAGSRRPRTVKNAGSGTITLTPASGTIDGLATIAIAPGDALTVVTNGTNWFNV